MRLLILSFYYPPDLCAGSFRTAALVTALRECAPSDTQIEVVTTLPNRYRSFAQEAAELEVQEGLEIHRIGLPTHRSDMLGQSKAFFEFARHALKHVADRDYDVIFATSSRLMTAALGAWIARRKRRPLYLDVRDIFVDTIADVLPRLAAWPLRRAFSALESWTMRRANRINLVSRGFEGYFRARYGDRSFSWFTNGIDDEFLVAAPELMGEPASKDCATVLYAGNIGEGQGLHAILPGLARALSGRARFIVIGDGGRRGALESAVSGMNNVQLRAPLNRAELLEAYRGADVLFLHLGSQKAFEKVLPSKLFEYAALGKPILAGVGGYAARFVREEIVNAAVFSPCNVMQAVAAFGSLRLENFARPQFIAKYTRTNIARSMAEDVIELAGSR